MTQPMLHMLCGKMAAGKSTLAAKLSEADTTILITEDDWLGVLFSDQMKSGADYVRYSARLRAAMGPHVTALLRSGVSVVLDFAANTEESRRWMRGILDATGAEHCLHVLMPPDDVCLERLRARNERGDHPFAPTEAQFYQFSKHFMPPAPDEGFTIEVHE